jgi:SRI (Set2 Rpb1 interacting) domain
VLGGGTVDADAEKKIKDDFLAKMASTVVSTLNPFLKPECKQGRITCSEDFKHLARRVSSLYYYSILFQISIIFVLFFFNQSNALCVPLL